MQKSPLIHRFYNNPADCRGRFRPEASNLMGCRWILLLGALFSLSFIGCTPDGTDGTDGSDNNSVEVAPPSGPNIMSLSVNDPRVRACDIIVSEVDSMRVQRVHFDQAVKGAAHIRSPKTGIALIARQDQGLSGQVAYVELQLNGNQNARLIIEESTCTDRLGKILANVSAHLDG